MASIKTTPSGTFQLSAKSKLLPKPFWSTFDTYDEAYRFGQHLEALLAQGIIPSAMLEPRKGPSASWSVARCIAEYLSANTVPVSDVKLLDTLKGQMLGVTTAHLTYDWADGWIRAMKREHNLSPSTIRHRHGALARCLDWILRKHGDVLPANPLRMLKRGFATYNEEDDKHVILNGGTPKVDVSRNRRLEPDEEPKILAALSGRPDERAFFVLALETAMRMRECYTLDRGQISIRKKTIHLDRTKNGDGRQVPLSSTAIGALDEYMAARAAEICGRQERIFPFWNGDLSIHALDEATADLSARFRVLFLNAGIKGFRFHDLRHEATCRLYEKTTLSDVLIARIPAARSV